MKNPNYSAYSHLTNAQNEYDHLIKIVIVGETSVGKTALLTRYIDDKYSESYMATIGVDFKIKHVEHRNKVIKLQVWDTAGQERFRTITVSYYRGSNAVIICFDLTNYESFLRVKYWMNEIKKYHPKPVNIVIALVGTKMDLAQETNTVAEEEIETFCNSSCKDTDGQHNFELNIKYFSTSSKTNTNIHQVFDYLIKECMEKFNKQMEDAINYNKGWSPSDRIKDEDNGSTSCCN
jgi:Ras-related protein Rab-1A